MSAELVIEDGSPNFWTSSDIWVVPGNDPSGAPGQPIAGLPAFMWARVNNTGDVPINGAEVKFYWSNPATGVLRSNSTYIGSAYVDLSPGETQEVLCLTPWVPVVVNNGHECVVAEIIHFADPLPSPLPDPFNPPAFRQVAQRNLSVLEMGSSMMMMTFQVAAPPRKKLELEIAMHVGKPPEKKALEPLGLKGLKFSEKEMVNADIVLNAECGKIDKKQRCDHLKLDLEPGTAKAVTLRVEPINLQKGYYTPIDIVATCDGEIFGGLTVIVTQAKED